MTQALATNGNAVTAKGHANTMRGYLMHEERKNRILNMLPESIGKERFMELVLTVVSTPEIAACTAPSIASAVFACARLGLVPDPLMGHIYIIPRKMNVGSRDNPKYEMQATVQMGYRGMIELGRRTTAIGSVHTEIVYEGDRFRYWIDEHGKHLLHEPNLERDEDNPTAVYCVVELLHSHPQIEVLTWAKATAVDTGTPAWKGSRDEMAKKTVVRRAFKLCPQSPELSQAIAMVEKDERGEIATGDMLEPPTPPEKKLSLKNIKTPSDPATKELPVLTPATEPTQPPTEPPAAAQAGSAAVGRPKARTKPPVEPGEPTDAELKADNYVANTKPEDLVKYLVGLRVSNFKLLSKATKELNLPAIAISVEALDEAQLQSVARRCKLIELEGNA